MQIGLKGGVLRNLRRACDGVAERHGRRAAGALLGCRRSSAFWRLGRPKTHHEIKDSLDYVKDLSRLKNMIQ